MIYRELQVLDEKLISRHLDGSYHMTGSTNNASEKSQGFDGETSRREQDDMNNDDLAFAIPQLNDFEIPTDFFNLLPELEPISANVNAGFDIDLDKPWY